jgi:hypothetical protein
MAGCLGRFEDLFRWSRRLAVFFSLVVVTVSKDILQPMEVLVDVREKKSGYLKAHRNLSVDSSDTRFAGTIRLSM